ncbi:MAG: triose-phosphate isomerase [Calditrichaeota bacterium]|jgi:triosephosphate isomerase (TIM)|nr:triose-phosphate isomerase [Calditrichota bacterium]MBT7618530.1 triose-phosphate isomerase [Calditrichota bacterium]MBT7789165.1 triose-phosphate isomerase [Calditrichota bacterium]
MREKIIAGNWKMNTLPSEGIELAKNLSNLVAGINDVTVVVCPPATHLVAISQTLKMGSIGLGAQNVHWESSGAYTGELSAGMLLKSGCTWVIIGHSERRSYFGETDRSVNKRLKKSLEMNLRPIVCIGETLPERESGRTFQVLEKQLELGLDGVELKGTGGMIIAYEPVWAIGTGVTATTDQAQEAHKFIRDKLSQMFSRETADLTTILYGGSMNEKNAGTLMEMSDVDGGLIGGASLKAEQFAAIVKAASNATK